MGQEPRTMALVVQSIQERGRLDTVLSNIRLDAATKAELQEFRRSQVELLFAYWAAKLHHPRALLDARREKIGLRALRDNGGDEGELLYVVDGAAKDEWTMGTDPRSTRRHDGFDRLFQNRATIEYYAELCPKYRQGLPHPIALKYLGGLAYDPRANGNGRLQAADDASNVS